MADGNEAEIQIWEHDEDGVHDFITKVIYKIKSNKIEAEWEYQYIQKIQMIYQLREKSEKGYQWPEYFFRVLVAGKSADSGLLKFKDHLEFSLIDSNGNPLSDVDFTVYMPDGKSVNGKVNKEGKATKKDVPPGKSKIELKNQENVKIK